MPNLWIYLEAANKACSYLEIVSSFKRLLFQQDHVNSIIYWNLFCLEQQTQTCCHDNIHESNLFELWTKFNADITWNIWIDSTSLKNIRKLFFLVSPGKNEGAVSAGAAAGSCPRLTFKGLIFLFYGTELFLQVKQIAWSLARNSERACLLLA